MASQHRKRGFFERYDRPRPGLGMRKALSTRRGVEIVEMKRDLVDRRLWQGYTGPLSVLSHKQAPVL